MDLFFFHKAEKDPSPIPRCNLIQIAAKLFRFLELCFLLLFLSWILSRLPVAVTISAEFTAKLLAFIATPLFGFLLCNAIIVALVAKPSQFAALPDESDRIYQNLIQTTGSSDVAEEIVYQDKQIVAEAVEVEAKSADPDPESGFDDRRVIVRTLSEKLVPRERREKLRRSETEIRYFQEDLSSEEFQRKIEEFIAKEKRFRREESSAIVLLHCDGSSFVQK